MSKIAVFPGSFDPFTKGHEVIVEKALKIFDQVIVAIGVNSKKQYLFDLDKRKAHIAEIFKGNPNVKIEDYTGLTIDFCAKSGADHIIRGLRDNKDFEFEKSIAHMNLEMSKIDTVFFLTDQKLSAINASIVREIYKNKGNIDKFVSHLDKLS